MATILIIIGVLIVIGLFRVIRKPRATFIRNLKDVFFIDIISEILFSIMDFFDID